MPAITRFDDRCTGHDCWPPRVNDEASSNVFVNNKGVHRLTDHWVAHTCRRNTHDGYLSSSSENVFANNLGIGRIGDHI